jgi:NADPH2:quinone reductase
MRAILCKEYGPAESLVLEEIEDPTPRAGQVVVDVAACSVNFPDTLMLEGKYQFKPPFPFSPGGEIAGTVSAVADDVTSPAVGDRVFVSTGWGGLQEKVAVSATSCVAVPDGADLVAASAFLYAYGTSYYALADRAKLQAGETLLVLGAAGGVGLAAVELGKHMGATVIAAASTEEKLALCRERGADLTINYETEDLKARARELTGGNGADVIYDAVGGKYAEPALRAIAWEGRFLVIGFAAGEIPRIPLNLALLKSCQIVGVFWGAFAGRDPKRNAEHTAELVRLWEAGEISPHVSSIYPLERAAEAIRELSDRKAKGKVVVTMT